MVGYDPSLTEMPKFAYGVAGGMSGFLTRSVTQPLDVLKIRLQVASLIFSSDASCYIFDWFLADPTATQYDWLLASSCCPSVCLSICL